jgi:hypothetical protein
MVGLAHGLNGPTTHYPVCKRHQTHRGINSGQALRNPSTIITGHYVSTPIHGSKQILELQDMFENFSYVL